MINFTFCIFVLISLFWIQFSSGTYYLQGLTAFHNVLLGMNKDPLEHMNVSYPKLAMIPWKEIDNCYVAEIGSRRINIFNISIGEVITEYFRENYDLIDSDNVVQGIKGLVSNLKELIEMIYDCVHKKDTKMKFGLTSLSHYTDEEFKSMLNPYLANMTLSLRTDSEFYCNLDSDDVNPPDDLDWDDKDKVSPVKNQLKCGSCYIFSALSALESQYLMINKEYEFSEQALLNCLPNGCNGGMMDKVWDYMLLNGVPKGDDNYVAKKEECKKYETLGKIGSYCWRSSKNDVIDEGEVTSALFKYGPLSGAMDAQFKKMIYVKDIYDGECSELVTHAILIVGYTEKYWIIKNSWGTRWGNKGFFRLERGKNKCGISYIFGVPFIDEPED